jgi:lipoprotein-releasing system permease protein
MFSFKVALRFLTASKLQTLFIALGIAVGVSVQVFIGSLIQGLQDSLIDSTVGNSSHITITASNETTFEDSQTVYDDLLTFDDSIVVVNRVLEAPANITLNASSSPVVIRGFEFDDANRIYELDERLTSGRLPSDANEILLGLDLVESLELSLNQTIDLFLPSTLETKTLTLVGIYDFGVTAINESWLITTLDTAQTVLSTTDISKYEMQINDVFIADILAEDIASSLDESYQVTNWKASNQELLSGLEGQSISSLMIQTFVLISVVLGIASVLAITVLQKSKQLGILKAMGTTSKQASAIFLFQGFLLGLIGAILGVALGLGLSVAFTIFAVNPDGTPIIGLTIDPGFIIISASIAIMASLLASFIPAARSAKLSVIEVIRNG